MIHIILIFAGPDTELFSCLLSFWAKTKTGERVHKHSLYIRTILIIYIHLFQITFKIQIKKLQWKRVLIDTVFLQLNANNFFLIPACCLGCWRARICYIVHNKVVAGPTQRKKWGWGLRVIQKTEWSTNPGLSIWPSQTASVIWHGSPSMKKNKTNWAKVK